MSLLRRGASRLVGKTLVTSSVTKRQEQFTYKDAQRITLYSDDDLVAVNKPAGMAVHAGPKLDDHLSSHLHFWQDRAGNIPHLSHRVDKVVSGVILLTRNTKAAAHIAELFHEGKIIKKYLAICVGVPNPVRGSVCVPIASKNVAVKQRKQSHRVVLRQDCAEDAQNPEAVLPHGVHRAVTEYELLSNVTRRCSLLELQPQTGKKHQIRVHLADALLCPVLGDHIFSGPQFRQSRLLRRKIEAIADSPTIGYNRKHVFLHAYELIIPHPGRHKPTIITAPPPRHFVNMVNQLGLELPRKCQEILWTERSLATQPVRQRHYHTR